MNQTTRLGFGQAQQSSIDIGGASGGGFDFGGLFSAEGAELFGMGYKGFSDAITGFQNASLSREIGKQNAKVHEQNAKARAFQGREELKDIDRAQSILRGKQNFGFKGVAGGGSVDNLIVDGARGYARARIRSEVGTQMAVLSYNYQAAISKYQGNAKAANQTSKAISSLVSTGLAFAFA